MVCTADRPGKQACACRGEIIKQIGPRILVGDEYIDAESGAYVIPGGIDPHTHLEMPFMGTTAAGNLRETGTWAAAVGRGRR